MVVCPSHLAEARRREKLLKGSSIIHPFVLVEGRQPVICREEAPLDSLVMDAQLFHQSRAGAWVDAFLRLKVTRYHGFQIRDYGPANAAVPQDTVAFFEQGECVIMVKMLQQVRGIYSGETTVSKG
jgi:hypothetical protein